MQETPVSIHATTPQLLRATVVAAVVALLLLIVAVLPAEYGYDPTGAGRLLGLNALHQGDGGEEEIALPSTDVTAGATVVQYEGPFKVQGMSLTLQPNEGAEIKALMRAGESFVFGWTSTGPVSFDMHGEKVGAGDEFSSYWKDRQQSASNGRFIAPFDGTHGWWWKNSGADPVTITVKVGGYFERLFMPG
jgi:hypothetical protein